jgi:hypothetical protein
MKLLQTTGITKRVKQQRAVAIMAATDDGGELCSLRLLRDWRLLKKLVGQKVKAMH